MPEPPQLQPSLSVIMLFPDGYESRRRAISNLTQQSVRKQIELVMVASQVPLEPDQAQLEAFGCHQTVLLGEFWYPGQAFSAGIIAARAPLVAYVEEHAFPEPTWAEALIRAHDGPYAAVGSTMGNANPNTLCSWVNMFEEFGPIVAPAASSITTYLGGHITCYKRDVLLSYGEQLARLMDNETALHIDLRERGYELYLAGDALTNHVNISRVLPYLIQDFTGQRSFAATRARVGKWNISKRALYVLASPLIPFVRLKRVINEIQRTKRTAQLLPRGLPLLFTALVAGTTGEAIGYIFGDSGANLKRKAKGELNRSLYVAADEKNY